MSRQQFLELTYLPSSDVVAHKDNSFTIKASFFSPSNHYLSTPERIESFMAEQHYTIKWIDTGAEYFRNGQYRRNMRFAFVPHPKFSEGTCDRCGMAPSQYWNDIYGGELCEQCDNICSGYGITVVQSIATVVTGTCEICGNDDKALHMRDTDKPNVQTSICKECDEQHDEPIPSALAGDGHAPKWRRFARDFGGATESTSLKPSGETVLRVYDTENDMELLGVISRPHDKFTWVMFPNVEVALERKLRQTFILTGMTYMLQNG